MNTDFLIIGSGLAGLSYALKIATYYPGKQITIVTKKEASESNTRYAQGGIAIVSDFKSDSFERHIEDTLQCGDGLCNRDVVRLVVEQGPDRLKELISWGVSFDLNNQNSYDLGREGGHSLPRVLHHKDITGFELKKKLLSKIRLCENITILENHFAIDLIVDKVPNLRCNGAYILDTNTQEIITITSGSTILATGGIGHIYGHTTNPFIATGDGIAIAYRAGADIEDMEFVQFHPTVLYRQSNRNAFLISEAVRGFGAYLKNSEGKRFVFKYDERGELASRDIVSRAIYNELKMSNHSCVYLDCTHLDMVSFKESFPTIYHHCLTAGIDVSKDWIPVRPAAHYLCGGIKVDINGQTSVKNLFACGECARTGLHGANRLASNSLLEAVVYAHQIYEYHKIQYTIPDGLKFHKELKKNVAKNAQIHVQSLKEELQILMTESVGIVRTDEALADAKTKVSHWKRLVARHYSSTPLDLAVGELRNMLTVAGLIIAHSLRRGTNKGGYFNSDRVPFVKELK